MSQASKEVSQITPVLNLGKLKVLDEEDFAQSLLSSRDGIVQEMKWKIPSYILTYVDFTHRFSQNHDLARRQCIPPKVFHKSKQHNYTILRNLRITSPTSLPTTNHKNLQVFTTTNHKNLQVVLRHDNYNLAVAVWFKICSDNSGSD
jgi:hypothetical protein